MSRTKTLVLCAILCGAAVSAVAEELRPVVFRTPDERFENLKDYAFASHYMELDSGAIRPGLNWDKG